MTAIEERFSSALHSSARAWRQAIDRRLKHLGLSQASWMTIASVAKAAAPLSQTEVAHKLGVEDPTMVSMIDRLVKAGFLLRQQSATDRRVKLVVLTPAGQQVYEDVLKVSNVFRAELLKDVDLDKLQALTELLEHVQGIAEAAL